MLISYLNEWFQLINIVMFIDSSDKHDIQIKHNNTI